jgi:hypothetical protein
MDSMSESDKPLVIAKELKNKNGHYWRTFEHIEALMGWLHHRGRCVYCGIELADATHMIGGLATTDHLLPKKSIQI